MKTVTKWLTPLLAFAGTAFATSQPKTSPYSGPIAAPFGGPVTHLSQARHALSLIADPVLRERLMVDSIVSRWDTQPCYSTIQTAVVGQRTYLLGRGATGMSTYVLGRAGKEWKLVAVGSPPWSDFWGWNRPEYYSTIQTAVVGDELYLLGRSSAGVNMSRFDAAQGEWVDTGAVRGWSDADGWNKPEYYSTIQTAVVGDELYLLGRSSGGVNMSRFDAAQGEWVATGASVGWSDALGWNRPEYYSTIQTAVVGDELYLLCRGSGGVDMLRFDAAQGKWVATGASVGWSDALGWNRPEYYSTIQTAVVGDELYLLGRSSGGVNMSRFDAAQGEWVATGASVGWSDALGWNRLKHYTTIQTATVGDRLYLLGRSAGGVNTSRFDAAQGEWVATGASVGWSDDKGWDHPQYYSTIQTAAVGRRLYLLGRSSGGMNMRRLSREGWESSVPNGPRWGDPPPANVEPPFGLSSDVVYFAGNEAAKIYRAYQSGAVFPDIPNPGHVHDTEVFHAGFGTNPGGNAEFLTQYARHVKENLDDTELLAHFFGTLAHVVGDHKFDGDFIPAGKRECVLEQLTDLFWDVTLDNAMADPLMAKVRVPNVGYVPAALPGILLSLVDPPIERDEWPHDTLVNKTERNLYGGGKYYSTASVALVTANVVCGGWGVDNFFTAPGGVHDGGAAIATIINETWRILKSEGQVPYFVFDRGLLRLSVTPKLLDRSR